MEIRPFKNCTVKSAMMATTRMETAAANHAEYRLGGLAALIIQIKAHAQKVRHPPSAVMASSKMVRVVMMDFH